MVDKPLRQYVKQMSPGEPCPAGLVCPKCKKKLRHQGKQLKCKSCGLALPILEQGLIPLFDDPGRAIAQAYINLYHCAARWRNLNQQLTKALKSSGRKKVLLPQLKVQNDNRDIFERWALGLESEVKPAVLLEQTIGQKAQPVTSYGYSFNYLTRDWTSQPSGSMEVNHVLKGLRRCLRLSKVRGRACVLGMGTGRFGLELTDYFQDIWGIDASFGQLRQYHELLTQDITFWQINNKNQMHHRGMVKKMTASMPERLKKRADIIKYVWADALNSPFEKHYFDWVFSIYFSDVKPLPDLLKEVKRILRPGGLFLHYGPLEYHFKNIEHHYGFDEFRAYFIDNGFEVIHESTSRPPPVPQQATALVSKSQYIDKVLLLRLRQGNAAKVKTNKTRTGKQSNGK